MITLIFISLCAVGIIAILISSNRQTAKYITYKSRTKYGTIKFLEGSQDIEYFRRKYEGSCNNPAPNAILVEGAVYFPYSVEEIDSKGRVVNTTKLI